MEWTRKDKNRYLRIMPIWLQEYHEMWRYRH